MTEMTDKERIEALEKALLAVRECIMTDEIAITDTLWMPAHIQPGCTAVDYIDIALGPAKAPNAYPQTVKPGESSGKPARPPRR